jgi:hypothetical protein
MLTDDKKAEQSRNFRFQVIQDKLKVFLGFAGYYHRYVPNVSSHNLTGKNLQYACGNEQDEAFETAMCNEPLLQHPDFTKEFTVMCDPSFEPLLQHPDFRKEFTVMCDPSLNGIGAIFSQDKTGKDLPTAYTSRVSSKAERNYSAVERQLTATVWVCEHFRAYVWGRKITTVTSHKPLTWVLRMTDPSSPNTRLKFYLLQFEYVIVDIKNWRDMVMRREVWQGLLRKAKAFPGLSSQ